MRLPVFPPLKLRKPQCIPVGNVVLNDFRSARVLFTLFRLAKSAFQAATMTLSPSMLDLFRISSINLWENEVPDDSGFLRTLTREVVKNLREIRHSRVFFEDQPVWCGPILISLTTLLRWTTTLGASGCHSRR